MYAVDFGLSKLYKDKNGEHIEYKDNKSLVGIFNLFYYKNNKFIFKFKGTARYASIYT